MSENDTDSETSPKNKENTIPNISKYDKIGRQKSHSNRIPVLSLLFFLSVFTFTVIFMLLPVYGITEISIFGFPIIPHDLYMNFINAIITPAQVLNFWNTNPIAFIGLIAIFIIIVLVLFKFISSFKEPLSEFDSKQTDGAVTYFNFSKIYSRTRLIFVKPTNDRNSDTIRDWVGSIFNFKTNAKTANAVYCVPDKRNKKIDNSNFFLEFPECFDINNLRNYMSEHSWITLATNLATIITVTILVVGSLLNVALNILTQSNLNPYTIFGVTSWISLSAITSICAILIWALREIKGNYGVFRIVAVLKTPLDVDRYIVMPYYWDGISGTEIDSINESYSTFYNKDQSNSKYVLPKLPLVIKTDKEPSDEKEDERVTIDAFDNNSSFSDLHTAQYYIDEIDHLKTRNTTLQLEKERALILVEQYAKDNTELKKSIRLRKSIDYSTVRSLSTLQEQIPVSPQQSPTERIIHTSDTPHSKDKNSWLLPAIIIGIIGAIAFYYASITFSTTEFLVILVVGALFVIGILFSVGLLILRQYLNETSSGKRINFG